MKNNPKYRIVKFTSGDTSIWYEVQKKGTFGKWSNCIERTHFVDFSGEMTFPVTFKTFEDAEKAYFCSCVEPTAVVVKEYE